MKIELEVMDWKNAETAVKDELRRNMLGCQLNKALLKKIQKELVKSEKSKPKK